jgi:non-heme chloroperoxidase
LVCLLLAPLAATSAQQPKLHSAFVTTSDGVQIHYVEAGSNLTPTLKPASFPEPSGAPRHDNPVQQPHTMLFVPGWIMPGWIWEKQITHFSQTHRVAAMDPRCQGESSQTTDGLSPAVGARDIKAVVDQLLLAPVVLVGWSMAAGEIASYVDQFGTKEVAAIVFVDEVPAEIAPGDYKRVIAFIDRFVEDRRGNGEKLVRSFFKKPQPEDFLRRVVAALLQTPTNTAVTLLVGKFAVDLSPTLRKIDKPYFSALALLQQHEPGVPQRPRRIGIRRSRNWLIPHRAINRAALGRFESRRVQ